MYYLISTPQNVYRTTELSHEEINDAESELIEVYKVGEGRDDDQCQVLVNNEFFDVEWSD